MASGRSCGFPGSVACVQGAVDGLRITKRVSTHIRVTLPPKEAVVYESFAAGTGRRPQERIGVDGGGRWLLQNRDLTLD